MHRLSLQSGLGQPGMATQPAAYPVMGRVLDPESSDASSLQQGQAWEAEWKPGRGEYAVMVTLAVISLMVALDATILVSVLPTLALDLGGSTTDAFWAGTSYLLSSAVCQPFIAALSDIFGRKEMLLLSILLFALGTLLCAPVANTFAVFFVGRSIQGVGGGGIITLGQVIFADIVPLRQRPKYFSIVLAAWALGSVLGPLIGGLFVEHLHWAWCFYINFPFCALGLVLVPIYVKLTTVKTSLMSKLGRVDWIGGVLFIGSLTSFLIGISWAGVQFPWKSVQVIAPTTVGVVGVTAAIVWETSVAREPFLRPSLFYSTSAIATYACALLQGFILFCALYYVPFYFTAVRFERPTQSGLDTFPVTCFLLPGSIVVSLITTRVGRYRWAIRSGWVITALGCGFLVLLDANTKTPVWAAILAIFGIGHGMLLTSINVGVQAVSRIEDAGRAAAMYAFMRSVGMSIGVAAGGTVFQNVMADKLGELGLPVSIAHDAEAFVMKMSLMNPEDPMRIAAIQAYLAGFHGVYWAITGVAIAAFAISLIIRRHSMDKLLESKFVLKGGQTPLTHAMAAGSDTKLGSSLFSSATPSIFEEAGPYGAKVYPSDDTWSKWEKHHARGIQAEPQTVDDLVVAYYIQPGGVIRPVDIISQSHPHSSASTYDSQKQEHRSSLAHENHARGFGNQWWDEKASAFGGSRSNSECVPARPTPAWIDECHRKQGW